MSRATMIARAVVAPRAPIYGIGRYEVGSHQFDFEVGWPEFARDIAWAQAYLTMAGLGEGDTVLITAAACEGPWIGPVVRAIKALGITYIPAEVYAFDAGRSAALLQQFDVKAFLGLGAETIDGWLEKGMTVTDLLDGVEAIWARPAALPKLADVSDRMAPIIELGPALALGLPGETRAELNAEEWCVDEQDGLLYVSAALERAADFDRAPTGFRGTVSKADGRLFVEFAK